MPTVNGPPNLLGYFNRQIIVDDVAPNDFAPLSVVLKHVAGVVYDSGGVVVSGATVKLFRVSDDLLCGVTTSDGSGNYSFDRDFYDPYTYYVVAYSVVGGTTQIHGTSDRSLAPS